MRSLAARPAVARGLPDAALVAVGLLALVLAALPVDARTVSDGEAAVFGVLNGSGVLPFVLVWPLMQLGNVAVVPASALLIAGAGAYVLAKVAKGLVSRGRPDDLLAEVVIRGAAAHGRGFVSGHAAVVTALLVVAWPALGRAGRITGAVLVAAVCWSRLYVGAHLPLDVVGGAALGLAVAGVVRLVLGRAA